MAEDETGLYDPFERLVKLTILEKEFEVPEKNTLLRCYQYLSPEEVANGNFCWNGDCHNCQVTLRRDGFAQVCLSCQTLVKDGDSVEHISPDVTFVLREILKDDPPKSDGEV